MKFFDELKRRNVIKATIAYIVVAWVLLQVISIVLPNFEAPPWAFKTLTFVIVIGLPIWVIFSWVYEVTPEGLKKTAKVSKEQSITAATNKRLNIIIIITLVIATGVSFINKPTANHHSKEIVKTEMILDNSIAVLPFDNMSSDKDNQWFCDGVTEDILTHLSKIKGLRVISRTSVLQYKDSDKTIPEIAKELNVSYVLEGSVRKYENNVLITAQLIKNTDEHLWADNYNEKLDNVFKIQADVSKKIVQQLKIALSPEEEKLLNKYPTNNIKAYQLFLKGRSFIDKLTVDDIKISRNLFSQAIALDPNYSDAYAELAFTYLVDYNGNIKINRDKAKKYIDKALEINPNSSIAYSRMGLLFLMKKENAKSNEYLEKAIELNPNDAKAHDMIANYYLYLNYEQEENKLKSLYHINKAEALDPLSTTINILKINILLKNGKIEEAEEHLEAKKSLFSNDRVKRMNKNIIEEKGKIIGHKNEDLRKAVQFYHKAIEDDPNNPYLYMLLGDAYDYILNDDITAMKFKRMAYKLDSTHMPIIKSYFHSLLNLKKFDEAKKLYNTKNFSNILTDFDEQSLLWSLFHEQGNYKKANEILKDDIFNVFKIFNYARLGDLKNVNLILSENKLRNTEKASVYAILKERDSMYYYMNKKDINIKWVNGSNEFDPYRNEPKFKAFQKEHYLPVLEK